MDQTVLPDGVTAVQLALSEAARMVILALAPILVAALTAGAVQLFRKFGIELDAQKQAKIEYYAKLAIQEAEEWAAKRLQSTQIVVSGADKLERAATALMNRVPGISEAEAKVLIHSLLPAIGIGAAATLGKVTAAATTGER